MNSFWFYTKQSFLLIVLRRLRNFPMLLLLAVLFVLMSFKANWVLGAPYLFWHDNFFEVGIFSLLAVGLLLEEWAFVAVLLDTDENNPINLSLPGQHHSRISLIAAVKDYLGIESISASSQLENAVELEQPGSRIIASAAGGMTTLSSDDQARIFATVREIHSVGTYTLAFLFGFCSAYVYQWQNENLIVMSSIGLVGYQVDGIDLLGPILVGGFLLIMVYLMFLIRRLILRFAEPLIRLCDSAHRTVSQVPGVGRTLSDWLLFEIIRKDSIFREFHLIAFVKNLLSVLFVLLLSLIYWTGYRSNFDPSVALIVCVVLSGVLGVYGWMVFQRRRLRYEFVIGILLILVLIAVFQMYRIPQAARVATGQAARDALPLSPTEALNTVKTEAVLQMVERKIWKADLAEETTNSVDTQTDRTERKLLKRWKAVANQSGFNAAGQTVLPTDKPVLVLVSNTGGGIKAQVWSNLVLHAVENLISQPDAEGNVISFPRHVRLISGASGGMVGAGYWVATLSRELGISNGQVQPIFFHREQTGRVKDGKPMYQWLSAEESVQRMSADCLSRVARQGFFNDLLGLPMRWLGIEVPPRGEALENALAEFGPSMGTQFAELKTAENEGWLPTLIYTPTSANDGRRFLISNQPLEYLFYSQFQKSPEDQNVQLHDVQTQDVESNAAYSWRLNYPNSDMTLATAARLSANFPIFVDSPFLPFLNANQPVEDHGCRIH